MLDHAVAEKFPKEIAAQLRQYGVDEKVLFFQRLGQRTTGAGVLVPDIRIRNTFRDDLQAADCRIFLGLGLRHFLGNGSQHDLSCRLGVSEIHPVKRLFGIVVVYFPGFLKEFPQIDPRLYVIRAGDGDIGKVFPKRRFRQQATIRIPGGRTRQTKI